MYLITFPVSDRNAAAVLGNETAWDIIEELREAGVDGLTVKEIVQKLQPISDKTVHRILQRLQDVGWVESSRKTKKVGRPKEGWKEHRVTGRERIYFENIPWGAVSFEPEFEESVSPLLRRYSKEMETKLIEVLKRMIEEFKTIPELEELLPGDELCIRCKQNHEAREFLWALRIGLVSRIDVDGLMEKEKWSR